MIVLNGCHQQIFQIGSTVLFCVEISFMLNTIRKCEHSYKLIGDKVCLEKFKFQIKNLQKKNLQMIQQQKAASQIFKFTAWKKQLKNNVQKSQQLNKV